MFRIWSIADEIILILVSDDILVMVADPNGANDAALDFPFFEIVAKFWGI